MTKPKIESKIEAVTEPVVKELSALETFTVNHPRTAKVVGITAITAATFAAIAGWKAHKLTVSDNNEVPEGRVVLIEDSSKTV